MNTRIDKKEYKSLNLFKRILKKIKPPKRTVWQELEHALKNVSSNSNITPELYILRNVYNMQKLTAENILRPRVDIVAVEQDIPFDELIKVFTKYGYSRLPVYSNSLDNILGFVHVKDAINALRKGTSINMDHVLRPVLFVSPYIKILDLLFEMIAKRHHISMVIDEYGGIDGLITIEDIIEQIVGDITDEHDKFVKKSVLVSKPGYLEVDGRFSLKDLEARTGLFATEEERAEVDTVGGLVIYLAGRVAVKNEVIKHPSGVEFLILAADPLKIIKVGVNYKAFLQDKAEKVDKKS